MGFFKLINFILIGTFLINHTDGDMPFKPKENVIQFAVYFTSRYRGLCVGSLVSRSAVLTAAVCCVHPTSKLPDRSPINVVVGSFYRHPKRGIRVQVTKIIYPKLPNGTSRYYLIQKSPALMLLRRSIPDDYMEVPARAIAVDYTIKQDQLTLREECLTLGWHFFYKGDKIYPVNKFLLQRNLRLQFVDYVKKELWCEALSVRFKTVLEQYGYGGYYEKSAGMCIKDSMRVAQPCHGMFGAPLVCRGKLVALMMAPDAQWKNCTGLSNIYHILSSKYTADFMSCIGKYFKSDVETLDMKKAKKYHEASSHEEDYIDDIYDSMIPNSQSSDES